MTIAGTQSSSRIRRSSEEVEDAIGAQVRAVRIAAGHDQAGLAALAGVSLSALKNLEQGKGTTLRTLVRVVRALGREDWFDTLAPRVTVSPIDVLRSRTEPRRRVYRPRERG